MRVEELVTWIAAGVVLVVVAIAGWQLWLARREAREVAKRSDAVRRMLTDVEGHAARAAESAQAARTQAERAWDQVKLSRSQLEEARQERRESSHAERWEWAYAVTMASRELVESCNELVRVAMDPRVATQHRLSADRHYHQSSQRWQETMIKAVSRTTPDLELQQQVITFTTVHQRLHGHLGVLLRAVETGSLADGDGLADRVHGLRQELGTAHRQLQRTVNASLANPEPATQQIAPEQAAAARSGQGTGPRPSLPTN